MSLICPQCGAENRAHAKFCLKCAKQLVTLPPTPEELTRDARRRKRRRRREAQAWAADAASESAQAMADARARSRMRWGAPAALVTAGLAALALAAILWTNARDRGSPQTDAALTAITPASAASPATAASAESTSLRVPGSAEATSSSPAAVLAAGEAASAALNAAPTSAGVRQPPVAAVAAAAPAPTRPASKTSRRAPERAPSVVEVGPSAAPTAPVAPGPAPAAPTAPAPLCADRAFISRAICLQSECNKPALRQHPSCIRMREQQDALKHASGGG
ncbi:zinc ribbon domain-containing protein [Ottowia flava]|uniref:Zinc ribbon domain-containing protein n=1 Tax=Ottowia flava TaxID=2675430 RepID=A0ABW4KS42_9BURK